MGNFEEREYILWLYRHAKGDLKNYKKILSAYESPEEAFFSLKADRAEHEAYLESLQKQGIRFLTQGDEAYPELLSAIYDPPEVLFVKGRLPERERMPLPIAVIGSRK